MTPEQVPSKKPRITGFVEPELKERFEQYLAASGLSPSEAVIKAIHLLLMDDVLILNLPATLRQKIEEKYGDNKRLLDAQILIALANEVDADPQTVLAEALASALHNDQKK